MRGRGVIAGAVVLFIAVFFWSLVAPSDTGPFGFVALITPLVVCFALPVGICLEISQRGQSQKTDSSGDLSSLDPRERIVKERVLVICPYCGTKNDQGIIKCRKCGAEV
jgi:hypothetical protein